MSTQGEAQEVNGDITVHLLVFMVIFALFMSWFEEMRKPDNLLGDLIPHRKYVEQIHRP